MKARKGKENCREKKNRIRGGEHNRMLKTGVREKTWKKSGAILTRKEKKANTASEGP